MANAPGGSPSRDSGPSPTSTAGAGGSASGVPGEGILPQNVVRRCSKCAAPLTVAERMFYFLEAIDAYPLCRPCLVQASRSGPLPFLSAVPAGPMSPADRAPSLPSTRTLPSESPVDTAIRIYLREELERAKLTLAHLPETDPGAQPIRGLFQEAYQQLSADRLLDAIITVRDLREIMIDFESSSRTAPAVPGPAPTASPPEPVDEATKRARELAAHTSPPSGDANP